MPLHIKLFLIGLLSLLGQQPLWATHNRAGEIIYKQIGPLTIRAKIITYTKISGSSAQADRDELELFWGDGSSDIVPRTAIISLSPDIQQNEYEFEHTYPGTNATGRPYPLSMSDPNRNANILNVNGGASDAVEFYLETEVYLWPVSVFGYNSSPILLEPPIDFGVVGQVFQHAPNAYDPDGDSIAYELVTPLMSSSGLGVTVPGYLYVDQLFPSANNNATLDPQTGVFTWDAPQQVGLYNIAILIKQYRNGLYLGGIIRDIQIDITDADNRSPQIVAEEQICVYAGNTIDLPVTATDPDIPIQTVTLSSTGGAYQNPVSPATFVGPTHGNPVTRRFLWTTECDHVRAQPYQVIFKAKDSFDFFNSSLATFKTLTINVVAPAPQNLEATVIGDQVNLTWDAPYACENTDGFFGFSVWRREGCNPTEPDSCNIGLAGLGYTQINFGNLVNTTQGGRYTFVDNDVDRGVFYSYRLAGEFGTPAYDNSGNVVNYFDPVSSMPSSEICIQTNRDLPLMTHADVNVTDASTGEVYIQWSRPHSDELDTLQNPPPYRYELYRSADLNGANFGFSPIYTSPQYSDFYLAVDTFFTDTGLNTEANAHSYRVAFYANGDTLGFTSIAASIFLNVAATDETNNLTWQENVPWVNEQYVVHVESPTGSGTFVVLDTVPTRAYSHTGLINGEEYCYFVEAIGTYGLPYIQNPLLNKSQLACGVPLDTIAPCPPDASAIVNVSGCDNAVDGTPSSDLFNTISWMNNSATCAADVANFRVYFAPFCRGQYTLIGQSAGLTDTFVIHQPDVNNLAGCYYITSVDSVEVNGGGNESEASGVIQTDNCPIYKLPNVFTPNGDDRNEVFAPFKPYRYIQQVEFKVHNRWGQLVFETTDPEIIWDGRDRNTGQILAEGVYYYTCMVYESRLNPQQAYPLRGYIHIIHNGD